jgi:L-iditol 2-dehydrogenase
MTMLAAVYHGPNDLRVESISRPPIGTDEVLLKVLAASICGTDMRILHGGHRKYPEGTVRVPGHEVVGEIAEIGANIKGFTLGQRVFVDPNMGCGHCRQCMSGNNNICPNYDALGITLDGGFAEYVRIPAAAVHQGNLIAIDAGVDPAAAALIEPFACVLRGQERVNVQSGDVVLVAGAGPIGVMHMLLARLRGAIMVIVSEPSSYRRERALQFGADRVFDPTTEDLKAAVMAETEGAGADVIITASPAPAAQEQALALAAMGGRVLYFGGLPTASSTIRFDSNLVHYKELIVTGTTACSTRDCLQAVKLLNAGRLNLAPLISERFPLHLALDAFTAAGDRTALKVVLEP